MQGKAFMTKAPDRELGEPRPAGADQPGMTGTKKGGAIGTALCQAPRGGAGSERLAQAASAALRAM